MNLVFFTNDRYKVLQCMVERQIEINGQNVVPLSQQNIADIVQLSKKKVNAIIGELKINGYIQQQNVTRGRYLLAKKAVQTVKKIQKEEAKTND